MMARAARTRARDRCELAAVDVTRGAVTATPRGLDGARVTAGDVRVTAVRDGLCRRAAREALDGG